jgi:XRE family transcriptional regulator, fatty acid utilization regulator
MIHRGRDERSLSCTEVAQRGRRTQDGRQLGPPTRSDPHQQASHPAGLAERAHVSLSLLTKVESGGRTATPALLAACARALGVDLVDLTGASADTDTHEQVHAVLEPVRMALDLLDPDPDPDIRPRPIGQLHAAVRRLNQAAQAARYQQVAAALPALLAELHTAAVMTTGSARAHAYGLLAETARVGHTVGIGLARPDLSPLALIRMDQAAQHAAEQEPGLRAIRDYLRITTALRGGDYDASKRLHASAVHRLEGADADDPGARVARGQLHLGAAVIAARTGDADDVASHIAAAQRYADVTGERDTERFWVGFGPANIRAHRVITAVELGDYARAVTEGHGMEFPPGWLPSRVAHVHLDLARAHLWTGSPDAALADLQHARVIAPQQVRRHPSAKATIDALMRGRRKPSEALRALAAWVR